MNLLLYLSAKTSEIETDDFQTQMDDAWEDLQGEYKQARMLVTKKKMKSDIAVN